MTEPIDIPPLHTREMIDDETAICLGEMKRKFNLTLSLFLKMVARRPQFGMDGVLTDEDIAFAAGKEDPGYVAPLLIRQIAAVWRAFEIIRPSRHEGAERSEIPEYGPEWLADILAAAADAVPSLGVREMLDDLPMVLLVHLVAAAHRKNGGITRRPDDSEAIAEKLRELNGTC